MTKLCTSTFSSENPSSIETYIAHDGCSASKKVISKQTTNSENIKERKNIMSFMQGSITYLNQRTFEAFIELMDQEKDNPPESASGPTDI